MHITSRALSRKGISIIISEVIIIAASIIFILLAVNWILGAWRSEEAKFMVLPILSIKSVSNTSAINGSLVLNLHVVNEGDVEVKIIKVEVEAGEGVYVNITPFTVPPGSSVNIVIDKWIWIGADDPAPIIPGGKYRIKLYTEKFGLFIRDVVASR